MDIITRSRDREASKSPVSDSAITEINNPQSDKPKQDKDQSANSVAKRKQVLKLLLSLMLIFIICWGPTLVIHTLIVFRVTIRYIYETRLTAETLAFFNSCFNPYLFMFMSTQFREALRGKLVCFTRFKIPRVQVSTSGSKYTKSTNVSTISSNN